MNIQSLITYYRTTDCRFPNDILASSKLPTEITSQGKSKQEKLQRFMEMQPLKSQTLRETGNAS